MKRLVSILDGNTFVVCDSAGDIEASPTDPTGLFSLDTRYLSRWVLTVNGERLNALSTDDLQYFETRFFLVPGTGTVYVDAKLSVIRQRAVGGGFDEQLFASEELALSAALKKRGRFVVLDEAVVTSGRKLRSYSLGEVLGVLLRIALRGRRGVRQREGLELWYGERRPDPLQQ